jgi:gamma-glutamylcyclotransferase (GGCT)/AIG2-like uncharacterized protein YtfP
MTRDRGSESDREALFVYGTLAPRDAEEAARVGAVADAVLGRLFDLGPHPALIDLDDPTASWVDGFVREVSLDDLEGPIDAYEGVDEGPYRRASTVARSGRRVWAYVHGPALPEGARGPITRWEGARVSWDVFSRRVP